MHDTCRLGRRGPADNSNHERLRRRDARKRAAVWPVTAGLVALGLIGAALHRGSGLSKREVTPLEMQGAIGAYIRLLLPWQAFLVALALGGWPSTAPSPAEITR